MKTKKSKKMAMSIKNSIKPNMASGANFQIVDRYKKHLARENRVLFFAKFNHAVSAYYKLKEISDGYCVLDINFRNERNNLRHGFQEWVTIRSDWDIGLNCSQMLEETRHSGLLVNLSRLIDFAKHPNRRQELIFESKTIPDEPEKLEEATRHSAEIPLPLDKKVYEDDGNGVGSVEIEIDYGYTKYKPKTILTLKKEFLDKYPELEAKYYSKEMVDELDDKVNEIDLDDEEA
jgi:hypothetical protein